eukprot:Gb_38153 [translate_table: standard]
MKIPSTQEDRNLPLDRHGGPNFAPHEGRLLAWGFPTIADLHKSTLLALYSLEEVSSLAGQKISPHRHQITNDQNEYPAGGRVGKKGQNSRVGGNSQKTRAREKGPLQTDLSKPSTQMSGSGSDNFLKYAESVAGISCICGANGQKKSYGFRHRPTLASIQNVDDSAHITVHESLPVLRPMHWPGITGRLQDGTI